MKIYILERKCITGGFMYFEEKPDPQVFVNGNEAFETVRKEFRSKLTELGISDEFAEDEMNTDNGYFHSWSINNLSQCGDCMISDTHGSDEWSWRITEHDIPNVV